MIYAPLPNDVFEDTTTKDIDDINGSNSYSLIQFI